MNNIARIIELVQHPEKLSFSDKELLEQEYKKHSFAQVFQSLLLRLSLRFSPEDNITEKIEKLSVYSTHRELIKSLVYQTQLKTESANNFEKTEEKTNILKNNKTENLLVEKSMTANELPRSGGSNENEVILEQKLNPKENLSESFIDKLGISHLFSKEGNSRILNENLHNELEIEKENTSDHSIVLNEEEFNKNTEKHNINTENMEVELSPIEKLTFIQWLSLPQKSPVNIKKLIIPQEKQKNIINKFIEINPKISTPIKGEKAIQKIDFKKDDIKEIANLMTTTLALLYVEQGKYDTAITAFKILSLKYPEKSSYFASEIRKVNKLKNSK